MKRCAALLVVALACACHRPRVPNHAAAAQSDTPASDSGRVLPPSVQPGFQHVLDLTNLQHRLGAGVRVHGIVIGSTFARIDLDLGDRVVSVTLADPSAVHLRRARYFGLQPAGSVPPEVLGALAAALDASFAHDPFVGAWAGDHPAESCGSNLVCEEDRVVVDLPHDRGVVTRHTAWLALTLLLLAMLATATMVARER